MAAAMYATGGSGQVRRKHLMVALVWAAAGAPLPAEAQSIPAPVAVAQARQVAFAIPPQRLIDALALFGRQSGMQVSVDAVLVRGKSSPGVAGTMVPEQALGQLLTGTNITYRIVGGSTAMLEAAGGGDGATVLDPITVEGARYFSDAGRTEGTNAYVGSEVTVGSKIPTTIREIPQSVSVITRQEMDDQGSTTVDEALRGLPSIVVTPASNGFNPGFQARGFDVGTQFDGLTVSEPNGIALFDLSMYDRIEVLRGPAGLFQGAGQPGGAINLVRKRPTDHFQVLGSGSYGSWNNYRAEMDVSGPAVESKKLRYRLAATGQDRDFFYDVMHQRKKFLYGAVEADLTESTTLTLSGAYQDIDGKASWGQPRYTTGEFLPDRSTYVGADWSHARAANYEGYAQLEHLFDNEWKIQGSLRYMRSIWEQKIAASFSGGVDPATDQIGLTAYENPAKYERWTGDFNVSGPVWLFDRKHTLLAGTSGGYFRAYDSKFGIASLGTFDIDDHSVPEPDLDLTPLAESKTEEVGYYGQARIRATEALTLIVGGRLSNYEAYTRPVGGGWENTQKERHVVTPYFGVVYDVTDEFSLYASYTDIFRPQTNQSPSGDVLEPIVGKQYETGVKAQLFEGNLTAQAALFRIDDENRAQLIPGCAGSLCYEAAGEVRSEGIDLEVAGSPVRGLNLYAGYVYNRSSYENGADSGADFSTMTPHHSARLWMNYQFGNDSQLAGVSLGGGVRAQTRTSYGDAHQDAYAVTDLTAGYRFTEAISASFAVNNLFDTTYYETFSAPGFFNWPGEPRNIVLSLRARF